jgi:sulfite reductase (NADPH) hemoprotein beta-component
MASDGVIAMDRGTQLPGRLGFASAADVDEFVATLRRYERGELSADAWRAFRLVRGVYGQRQPDVQMLRVKIPQGVLGAPELRALAHVATAYADGRCHITTRQNAQFYQLRLSQVEAAMRDLAAVGLTTREACGHSVRTITACPLAGVDAAAIFDVTPYAEALTRYLLRGPLSSTLPRKFKIAFEGCHRDCVKAAINDLGFVARRDATGAPGFLVLCGGGLSTLARSGPVLVPFLPAAELLGLAEAVVRVFHREGDRKNKHKARLKWVVQRLGFAAFRAAVLDEWQRVRDSGAPALPFDPAHPPVEPPPPPRALPPAAAAPPGAAYPEFLRTNVRPQVQPGLVAVLVTLRLGDLNAAQLRGLADLCTLFGDGQLRATADQNLALRNVPETLVPALFHKLAELGLASGGAGSFADVVSCPGADTCAIAVTASRGMGRLISEHLLTRPPPPGTEGARVHVSGCPNGCGQHHLATIGLQGALRKIGGRPVPAYQLTVGGGLVGETARFGRLVGKIPARRGPEAIDRLVELWQRERNPDEDLHSFYARVPIDRVKRLLVDQLEVAPGDLRDEDYIDLGQHAPFEVSEGEGECAA